MEWQANLANQVILVTGASSGIGRHAAAGLGRAGAHVVVAARRREELDRLVKEIEVAGGRALAATMDVTSEASVRAAVAAAEEGAGPLTGLVNCSGIVESVRLLKQGEESWDRIIATNLRGTWLVLSEVARRMSEAGHGGAIVNIASILGLRQAGQVTAYATSKAAVIQLTKQAALELAPFGIRVNALAPGYIETDLNRDFFASEAGKALIGRIPQRRLGRLEDLDGPLQLLLSDASRYMTGSVIVVDGGHLVSSL
ncbi:MAG TPA: SDR family NAD(P)-dependent oxidoreductase [Paracoccaceae bacterium]|nr:SDR family NAD(P)-dependent oxidoreductase [Paracoccaceae bacterium]